MLLLHMGFETMRHLIQIVFTDAADEAVSCQLILHTLQLVTQSSEGVNNETLDDGQQDQGDEQEEGEVEEDSDILVVSAVWRLDDVADTSAGPDSLVQVEHEAGEDVVTLLVRVLALLALGHVEFSEEVEGEDGVDVADDGEEPHREHQLLAVVGDGLQDDSQGWHTHSNVYQVSSEEEVVAVSKDREDKVEEKIHEGL